ncbi:MAG: hypothetical protein J7513_10690 [Solirubrobacteraceae bacterium]|nr:hypothetical protein [Solirubrobacteraceae bacterium]
MSSKQPLYTALGWVTWTVGKRALKRKVVGAKPARRGRKLLFALVLLGGAGAGAYAVTNGQSPDA